MLRNVLCVVLALVVCLAVSGLVKADDATVVSADKGKVTLKVGDKDTNIDLKSVKVIGADGKEIPADKAAAALKRSQGVRQEGRRQDYRDHHQQVISPVDRKAGVGHGLTPALLLR